MLAGLTKLKPILEEKFPEGSPFPSALFSHVQRWEKSCKPKEEPPPSSPPAGGAAAGTSEEAVAAPATVAVTAGAKPTTVSDAMDTPKQAQGIIRKAARFLIEKEETKPMGYRLMRSVRWDILDKAPPAEGGKTQLPAPNAQQRTYFQKLLTDKEWKTIIAKAETAFTSGANHLWLDLQRLIAAACRELGTEYTAVRKAVLFETALLLQRIPDLPSLSFTDGSAFCDDATKDWLATEVQAVVASDEGVSATTSSADDPLVEERRHVNELVSAGKVEEALTEVQNNMRGSSNERDNFGRTVMIGTLLLKAKQPDIATSMLESLDQKIERYDLDKWEPDLAVEAWTALTSAYKASKVQKPQNVQTAIQEKHNTVLSKISKIDPRRAFTLSK
jgi:type VI secretion system protein VasJ